MKVKASTPEQVRGDEEPSDVARFGSEGARPGVAGVARRMRAADPCGRSAWWTVVISVPRETVR